MINYRPLAYKHLVFNSPLSEERAADLVRLSSPALNILDLGCGWGELLLRTLEANPGARGLGVDTDATVLDRGNRQAIGRGVEGRVEFRNADATSLQGTYDLIISIGATHVWGEPSDALHFFDERLVPGAKLLFGSGLYTKAPLPEIQEIFGELPRFDELQDIVRSSGLEIEYAEPATMEEWDAFEENWRKGLEESSDEEINNFARERKKEYEDGYRGVVGFCYLVGVKPK